jgi:hypothetical protein
LLRGGRRELMPTKQSERKYKYFIPDQGEMLDDATTFPSTWVVGPEDDAEWLAEDAAEYEHTNCDGWEASWPLTFHLFTEGDVFLGAYSVEREYDPVFHASKVKEKVPSGA